MQTNSSPVLPVTSMGKFTLMYFATAGFYAVYWFYRCWAGMETHAKRRYFKVGRAVFAVLFVLELFEKLQEVERQRENPRFWHPLKAAWIFIGAAVGQFLLTYWADHLQMGCWVRFAIYVLAMVAQFYAIYPAQLAINRIEQDPFGKQNRALNIHNHLWIAFGFYVWFMLLRHCWLYPTNALDGSQPAQAVEQQIISPK